ncbi:MULTISPECIES: tRNA lysidine(34) synthetase TilS [unclassified Carboxylicivirga]|uniref:tRNA lysidine(34) synthetase TilS n=1 Tax=Carboxylicivirga TaxID=1628153 RepID=UPI003D3328C5
MQILDTEAIRKVMTARCGASSHDKLLVATSGGADSMALLNVLADAGYSVVAAHCNFQLRGQESDADEQLVTSFCQARAIPLHTRRFDTTGYASRYKVSIEMAARDLRYSWFDALMAEHGLDAVVTGHHGNDAIETFFLNLVRGTGVRGLSGIRYRHGKVLRPLLSCKRLVLERYCSEQQIAYRHDASNDDTKFMRNKIRHELIPVFEQMNPTFFETMQANLRHLNDAALLLESEVSRFIDTDVVVEDNKVMIPISRLDDYPHCASLLFEVLRPYGFNSAVVGEVVKQLHGRSGKQFFSSTHRLIKDRHNLLVLPIEDIGVQHFWLEEGTTKAALTMEVKVYEKPDDFRFSRQSTLIHLDADLLDFPLLVRKWKQGDAFVPLGMKGFKKLSDFFIDEKYSLKDKEDAWLLLSGEDIVWVLGKRIDERYKVSNRTRRIVEIALKLADSL